MAGLAKAKDLEERLRTRAVTALARTPQPGGASVAAMKDILASEPFSTDALYGLGTYARRFRDAGQAADAESIAELLGERLRMAGDITPRLLVVLGAIMNCGCDRVLDDTIPFLSDTRDSVRAGAVRALQSMRDPKIDELIASPLASDPASEVRIAAMDAARVREPGETLVRALTTAATSATDPRVRYRAVDLIVQWMPKRGDLRGTLSQVASKDPESRVRQRAQASL